MQLGLASWAAFALVYGAVRLDRTAEVDLALTIRLQARRSRRFAQMMRAVSWPGFPPQSRVIPPALIAALWLRGHRLEAELEAAAWGTALLSTLVKAGVRRERPLAKHVQVVVAPLGGSSFPSGHVLTFVGVYGFLAYLANVLLGRGLLRRLAVTPLVILVGLVGPSRVYEGHHWPTDVLASYLLGIGYLEVLIAVYHSHQAAAAS